MRPISISVVLLFSGVCSAQQQPSPLDAFPGENRVAAHYVRLEGSGRPDFYWNGIRYRQTQCHGLGISVELPPPDTILMKVNSDVYYTETHLIEFEIRTNTFINTQCKIEVKTQEAIKVTHPFGICNLDPAKRKARGQCAGSYAGRPARTNAVVVAGQAGVRQIGNDQALRCNQYAWSALDNIHSTACIQTTSERWRSLSAQGAGAFEGLWVAKSTRIGSETGAINLTARATKVEKNIRVSRDLLNIAETQRYEITEVGGPAR
jgi:hypothetical protein